MSFPEIPPGQLANQPIGEYDTFVDYLNAVAEAAETAPDLSSYAQTADVLVKANNLSDVASAETARTNLGLGSMATATASDYLSKAGNLSGIADPAAARTNLSLGDAATRDVGTGAGTVAAGDGLAALDSSARNRQRRVRPAGWKSDHDALAELISTGVSVNSGVVSASVGGTDGNAILPNYGAKQDFRASATVKVTKATVGSKSYIGYTTSAIGTLPTAFNFTFGVGYLQGTGIVLIRENAGVPTTLVADAALTDGDEYQVACWQDRSVGVGNTTVFRVAVHAADGAFVAGSDLSVTATTFPPLNILIRTNVAAGGLSQVVLSQGLTGEIASALHAVALTSSPSETCAVRIPAKPNGKLVLALHGYGSNATDTGINNFTTTWLTLEAAGYTILAPDMGGNLWGNPDAQAHLVALHAKMQALGFDPDVFLWGNSMGGGAAATLISDRPFPIRAAYLPQPAVNYAALVAAGTHAATINAAYSVHARADSDPMLRPAASYAGVALMLVASASDTSISKASNADALATLVGSHTEVVQITASGNHMDASHFKHGEALRWFNRNA